MDSSLRGNDEKGKWERRTSPLTLLRGVGNVSLIDNHNNFPPQGGCLINLLAMEKLTLIVSGGTIACTYTTVTQ